MSIISSQSAERRSPQALDTSEIATILVYLPSERSLATLLEAAIKVAHACDAHISCVHVTPIEAYNAFDGFGGVFVMHDIVRTFEEQAARIREATQKHLEGSAVSWDFTHVTGHVPGKLTQYSGLKDLIMLERERFDFDKGGSVGLAGDLLHRSRTPLMITDASTSPPDPTGTAVIAWDASLEAAYAVRASMGLLKLASRVRILQILEVDKGEVFPRAQLVDYLSRHSIDAEVVIEPRAGGAENVAQALVDYTRAESDGYIVMGGYRHTRLGEFLFGGVTRTLLIQCPVPLVVAH